MKLLGFQEELACVVMMVDDINKKRSL